MKAIVTLEFGLFADIRDNVPLTLEAAKVIAGHLHLTVDQLFSDDVASVHRINLNSVTIRHGIAEEGDRDDAECDPPEAEALRLGHPVY